jgi:GTPase SAR1 family protein
MTALAADVVASGNSTFGIIMGVVVIFSSIVFWLLWGRKTDGSSVASIAAGTTKQKVDGVVLLGPSGGGKTVILHQLCSSKIVDSLPSMAPSYNQVRFDDGGSVQLVDFPGHERLQASMFEHVKGAKGIVFVLDATATKSVKQAALLLFHLLSSAELKQSTPLLVSEPINIHFLFLPIADVLF